MYALGPRYDMKLDSIMMFIVRLANKYANISLYLSYCSVNTMDS